MTEPLISVIVPVYNVEKYLNRCVDSLIHQTYPKLEIILVDDGSTDSSGSICDALAKSDARIQVIHKENGGSSSARNEGLSKCRGNFVTFVDSDDWLELDTYQYALALMQKYHTDCVEFDSIMVRSEGPVPEREEKISVFSGKGILQYFMTSSTKTGSYSVCRCLFPIGALQGLRFRPGKTNEDLDFKYLALSKCGTLAVSNQYKYHYFQSGNSMSVGGLKKRDFDLYEAANLLCALSGRETYGTIAYLGQVKKARTPFSLLSKIAYCGIADKSIPEKELVRRLKKEHRQNVGLLLGAPIPFSRKILSVMFCISFYFTAFLIRIYKVFCKST